MVTYYVRYSLLATLGHKMKGSISKAINVYGKDPKVSIVVKGIALTLIQFVKQTTIVDITKRKYHYHNDLERTLQIALFSKTRVSMYLNPNSSNIVCAADHCKNEAVR